MTAFGPLDERLRRIRAIAVGASAGGIEAMMQLFATLPAEYPLPLICVLHMPDHHGSQLTEVLQKWTRMKVQDAEDKAPIMAGRIYFAPAGYHLLIEEGPMFALSCEKPVNYSRPSIDLMMETAADAYGEELLGILLTGANQDGARGMKTIKDHGGMTVVQAPEEAKTRVMPMAAIQLQSPDLVQGLAEIKTLLLHLGGLHANH